MQNITLVNCEKLESGYKLTVTWSTGVLWWKKKHTRKFVGSTTVFHDIETGERPGTWGETELALVLWKWRYDNGEIK